MRIAKKTVGLGAVIAVVTMACSSGNVSVGGLGECRESDGKPCATVAPVSPAPLATEAATTCLRTPPGLQPVPELHVIGWHERLDKKPVKITIGATDQPIKLVLASYANAVYEIVTEPGAKVSEILMFSIQGGTSITGVPGNAPVMDLDPAPAYAYGWEPAANTGAASFKRLIDTVRTRYGGLEASFQGAYTASEFRVPFTQESAAQLSHYRTSEQACAEKCNATPRSGAFWSASTADGYAVEEDGLALRAGAAASSVLATSSKRVRCGKRYFELDVVRGVLGAPYLLLGVGFPTSLGSLASPRLGEQTVLVENNETIGVQLDLDAARIYFRTATGFRAPGNKSPSSADGSGGGAIDAWTYNDLIVAAELQANDFVRYRGAPPFTHAIPAGYEAGL